MLGDVFERFVQKSPISVMTRASLERGLGADRLDLWYERTAKKQYTRDLLFSSVYGLMNQVVFCVRPCVRAAYQAQQDDVGTSIVSVYNKLNGLETHTSFVWPWWPIIYSPWYWPRCVAFMAKRLWMKRCLCTISPTKLR
jgi:hypothetical protein